MMIKEIADRLKNAHTWYEVKWIEAELRALDGKTVLPELPEDVKEFISHITLRLQKHRSESDAGKDLLFQYAYKMYRKYNVDGHAALDALAEELSRIDKPNG